MAHPLSRTARSTFNPIAISSPSAMKRSNRTSRTRWRLSSTSRSSRREEAPTKPDARFGMKQLHELINRDDPGWPLVQQWIAEATKPVEVLPPPDDKTREAALVATQV